VDNVNNPPHYTKDKSIETWDAILSQLTDEEKIGALRFQIAKYNFRFGNKGGITLVKAKEDIGKCAKYVQKLLEHLDLLEKEKAEIQHQEKNRFSSKITNIFKKDKDEQ
jgi:hypothetical protein